MKAALTAVLITVWFWANSQINIARLVTYADSAVQSGIDYPMIPGAVMGIASTDSIYLLKGYGFGDFKNKTPVDPNETKFQLGSVGKVLTAIALIQQIEKGRLSVEDDVNKYLEGWSIQNPFQERVTPFHLLTHSGGFNDQFLGYMARSNDQVQPLGEHLSKKMPAVYKEPGTEINYSNYSYALAGHLVEITSGWPFEDYIQKNLFDPFEMKNSSFFVPDDYLDIPQYANGYKWRQSFVPTKMYPRHAKPAGSIVSTGHDMIRLAQMLLRRDSLLLGRAGYDLLFDQQFSNHPKLTGYSLGMEIQNFNGEMAIAKAGQVTGFLSFLLLFPQYDLAIFFSTNTETDNFLDGFMGGLMTEFFPPEIPGLLNLEVDIDEFTGHYTNERVNHATLELFFGLFQGAFELGKSESGLLEAFHDGNWHEYQFLGQDVFQNVSNADEYITFKRDANNRIMAMHRTVKVGGIQIPASYRKLNWFERPRFLNDEYPFALLVIPAFMLLLLIHGIGNMVFPKRHLLGRIRLQYLLIAIGFFSLFIWNIWGFFIPIIKLREQMALGIPDAILSIRYFNVAMALTALLLLISSISLWIKKNTSYLFRISYTVYGLVALSYVLILHHWNLLWVID